MQPLDPDPSWLPVHDKAKRRRSKGQRDYPKQAREAIIRQKLQDLEFLISPPVLQPPVVEENRTTDLNELPERTGLSHHFAQMAQEAQMWWRENFPHKELILNRAELRRYRRLRKIVDILDEKNEHDDWVRFQRTVSEVPGFSELRMHSDDPEAQRAGDGSSIEDRKDRAEKSFHTRVETLERRKPRYPKNRDYYEFDPDEPLERYGNFSLLEPTVRIFNAVIEATWKRQGREYNKKFWPNKKWNKQGRYWSNDYALTPKFVHTWIEHKYPDAEGIRISLKSNEFEYDIRVTKGEKPDPRDYRPVDLRFRTGKKILQLINEQPWIFEKQRNVYKGREYFIAYLPINGNCYWCYEKLRGWYRPRGISVIRDQDNPPIIHAHRDCGYEARKIRNLLEKQGFVLDRVEDDDIAGLFKNYYFR